MPDFLAGRLRATPSELCIHATGGRRPATPTAGGRFAKWCRARRRVTVLLDMYLRLGPGGHMSLEAQAVP